MIGPLELDEVSEALREHVRDRALRRVAGGGVELQRGFRETPVPGVAPEPEPREEEQDPDDFIEIELVDEQGTPVANEPFSIRFPDGTVLDSTLDDQGRARFDGIPSGTCQVRFPGRE